MCFPLSVSWKTYAILTDVCIHYFTCIFHIYMYHVHYHYNNSIYYIITRLTTHVMYMYIHVFINGYILIVLYLLLRCLYVFACSYALSISWQLAFWISRSDNLPAKRSRCLPLSSTTNVIPFKSKQTILMHCHYYSIHTLLNPFVISWLSLSP